VHSLASSGHQVQAREMVPASLSGLHRRLLALSAGLVLSSTGPQAFAASVKLGGTRGGQLLLSSRNRHSEGATEPVAADDGCHTPFFVYDLDKEASLSIDITEEQRDIHDNFEFEFAFIEMMKKHPCRVFDIASAKFFVVPAKTVHFYFSQRESFRVCPKCQEADTLVVKHLLRSGNYWNTHREQHLVPSLRCPLEDPHAPFSLPEHFPQLWAGGAMQVCLEATRSDIDKFRSLHVTYVVQPEMFAKTLRPSAERDLLAVYAGTPFTEWRRTLSTSMKSCADCVVLEPPSRKMHSDFMENWTTVLSRARFQVVPPGDTIERAARDQSIAMGVVPVYFDPGSLSPLQWQYLPLSPPLDWSEFSVHFAVEPGEQDFWPRMEKHLRGLVRSGEADRLARGAAMTRDRLRWTADGVGSILMEMLAARASGRAKFAAQQIE